VGGRAEGEREGLLVSERSSADQYEASDYVEFRGAGEAADGEYHCSECGYGVSVQRVLPLCPMCRGAVWEPSTGRSFSRGQRQ
jgi:rubrerythrin